MNDYDLIDGVLDTPAKATVTYPSDKYAYSHPLKGRRDPI